jgi:hypothetical protein
MGFERVRRTAAVADHDQVKISPVSFRKMLSSPSRLGGNAMYEDTYPWPIKCHVCLHEFTQEVGRMKSGKELRCPECGVRHTYAVEQFESQLAETIQLRLDPYRGMIRLKKPLRR